jgi:hypothetical protein
MVDNLRFGAINKRTDKWEDPTQASKKNKYKCPDCEDDVVFCKGEIVRPYFRHHGDNNCSYYGGPSESQMHKEGKEFIKFLLDKKIPIVIVQKCKCITYNKSMWGDEHYHNSKCNELLITNITEEDYINSVSKIEYSFIYNNSKKSADVALLNEDGSFIMIFEIYNTSRTKEINRPEPWCEINVRSMLENRDDIIEKNQYDIRCQRNGCKCSDCKIQNNSVIKIQKIFRGFASRDRKRLDEKKAELERMAEEKMIEELRIAEEKRKEEEERRIRYEKAREKKRREKELYELVAAKERRIRYAKASEEKRRKKEEEKRKNRAVKPIQKCARKWLKTRRKELKRKQEERVERIIDATVDAIKKRDDFRYEDFDQKIWLDTISNNLVELKNHLRNKRQQHWTSEYSQFRFIGESKIEHLIEKSSHRPSPAFI